MKKIYLLTFLHFLFSSLSFCFAEEVLGTIKLMPGESKLLTIGSEGGRLVGWRMAFDNILQAEKLSECPELGCGEFRSAKDEEKLVLASRFGSLGVRQEGSTRFVLKNLAPFPFSAEIVADKLQ